jgi:beta-lactamase class A
MQKSFNTVVVNAFRSVMGVLSVSLIIAVPLLTYSKVHTEFYLPNAHDIFKKTIHATLENSMGGFDERISIYYYDLTNKTSYGFNENDYYTPASLFKVPMMMAFYKMAEQDGDILKKTIRIDPAFNDRYAANIKTGHSVLINKSYTIGQLIDAMIRFSDNTAMVALQVHLQKSEFKPLYDLYQTFSFDLTTLMNRENNISPQEYSRFLIALYNKSFLTDSSSRHALDLLCHSEFSKGLAAGIPAGIRLAHKFGERGYQHSDAFQLHDCGIVFHPRSPYVLCIMTKGSDLKKQEKTIAAISNAVYRAVSEKTF